MYENKTIVCKGCGQEFEFTAGDQEFYAEKGLLNEPKYCRECRMARKAARRERNYVETTCTKCGGVARVPFQPSGDKPVYCSACFDEIRKAQQEEQE